VLLKAELAKFEAEIEAINSVVLRTNASASCIQRGYRSYRRRQNFKIAHQVFKLRRHRQHMDCAAVLVQTRFRNYRYYTLQKSAQKIQTVTRGHITRVWLNYWIKCIIVIQTRWRGVWGRHNCSCWRQLHRDSCVAQETAALYIQKCTRTFLLKRELWILELAGHTAAVRIQALYRTHLVHKILSQCRLRELERAEAAFTLRNVQEGHASIIIASTYRSVSQRRAYQAVVLSALTIQTAWRVKKAHISTYELRTLNRLVKRRRYAAIFMQRHWRRHRTLRNFIMLQKAIKTIQSFWRKKCVLEYVADQFEMQLRDVIDLKNLFDIYDCDQSGQLSSAEVIFAFHALGLPAKSECSNGPSADTLEHGVDFEQFLRLVGAGNTEIYTSESDSTAAPDDLAGMGKSKQLDSAKSADIEIVSSSTDQVRSMVSTEASIPTLCSGVSYQASSITSEAAPKPASQPNPKLQPAPLLVPESAVAAVLAAPSTSRPAPAPAPAQAPEREREREPELEPEPESEVARHATVIFEPDDDDASRLVKVCEMAVSHNHPGIDHEGIGTMEGMIETGRFTHQLYNKMWTTRLANIGVTVLESCESPTTDVEPAHDTETAATSTVTSNHSVQQHDAEHPTDAWKETTPGVRPHEVACSTEVTGTGRSGLSGEATAGSFVGGGFTGHDFEGSAEALVLKVDGVEQRVVLSGAMSEAGAAAAALADAGLEGVSVSVDGGGRLVLTSLSSGSGSSVEVVGSASGEHAAALFSTEVAGTGRSGLSGEVLDRGPELECVSGPDAELQHALVAIGVTLMEASEVPISKAVAGCDSEDAAVTISGAVASGVLLDAATGIRVQPQPALVPSGRKQRWCKKCKAIFSGSLCVQGHANFMYTTKIPILDPQPQSAAEPVPVYVLASKREREPEREPKREHEPESASQPKPELQAAPVAVPVSAAAAAAAAAATAAAAAAAAATAAAAAAAPTAAAAAPPPPPPPSSVTEPEPQVIRHATVIDSCEPPATDAGPACDAETAAGVLCDMALTPESVLQPANGGGGGSRGIERNAGGCEELYSDNPELWNIDGVELDLHAKYKVIPPA
jgi:hypothetical protein